jgi:hypothetical protein
MTKLKWILDKAAVENEPGLTNAQMMLTNNDLRPGETIQAYSISNPPLIYHSRGPRRIQKLTNGNRTIPSGSGTTPMEMDQLYCFLDCGLVKHRQCL